MVNCKYKILKCGAKLIRLLYIAPNYLDWTLQKRPFLVYDFLFVLFANVNKNFSEGFCDMHWPIRQDTTPNHEKG